MQTSRGCRDGSTIDVDPPANVLLESPSLSDATSQVCARVGDGDRNVLVVALSGNPDARLDAWRRSGGLPGNVGIVTVDETRSAAAAADGGSTVASGPDGTTISTTTVSGADDLTGIGIKIGKCLSAWDHQAATTHVCFDSITTMLQYVGPRKAFRFLHVVTRRITEAGGVAHFHFDATAHDARTVAMIESLFSEVYTFDADADAWASK